MNECKGHVCLSSLLRGAQRQYYDRVLNSESSLFSFNCVLARFTKIFSDLTFFRRLHVLPQGQAHGLVRLAQHLRGSSVCCRLHVLLVQPVHPDMLGFCLSTLAPLPLQPVLYHGLLLCWTWLGRPDAWSSCPVSLAWCCMAPALPLVRSSPPPVSYSLLPQVWVDVRVSGLSQTQST